MLVLIVLFILFVTYGHGVCCSLFVVLCFIVVGYLIAVLLCFTRIMCLCCVVTVLFICWFDRLRLGLVWVGSDVCLRCCLVAVL